MSPEKLAHNLAGIEVSLRQFLNFGAGTSDAMLVNNADWLDRLSYIELLQDVGVHFSISRMLSFESVKQRLDREQGLTFLEFNYSILQSYDFRELNRRHGAVLQMGGSDQWGNIVAGIDLARRTDSRQVFGLTTPLVTTSSGAKMGKSANGATWVSAKKFPIFEYWQFWRNTEDADVGRFLKFFTDLPVEECERLGTLEGAAINEAKKSWPPRRPPSAMDGRRLKLLRKQPDRLSRQAVWPSISLLAISPKPSLKPAFRLSDYSVNPVSSQPTAKPAV